MHAPLTYGRGIAKNYLQDRQGSDRRVWIVQVSEKDQVSE
jgi:hypothetical protein